MKARFIATIIVLNGLLIVAQTTYCGPPPPPNNSPVASISNRRLIAVKGIAIPFDGSLSSDPDGTIVKYEWDFNGSNNSASYDSVETATDHSDGAFDGKAVWTYPDTVPTIYTVWLRVTDNDNISTTAQYQIRVVNSLSSAITYATSGSTITLDPGTYSGAVSVGKSLTITGANPDDWGVVEKTIIDGGSASATVTFTSGSSDGSGSILKGLTVTNGDMGVSCGSSTHPLITRCVITGNGDYGGIRCSSSSSSPSIIGNRIFDNSGSGISIQSGGSSVIKNNIIFGCLNGLYFNTSTSAQTIQNNTIFDSVRGIYDNAGVNIAVSNCILWNNYSNFYGAGTITKTYCCFKEATGGTNISSDPLLSGSGHLSAVSPCIDTGDNTGIGTEETDIDGAPRISRGTVDRGADEFGVWLVDRYATGNNDGKLWSSAFNGATGLQSALDNSNLKAGEEIWVADGTYMATDSTDRAVSFVLKEGVALYGGFQGYSTSTNAETARIQRDWVSNATILSGNINNVGLATDNSYHVVKGADGAILDGFTIQDGYANASSGDNRYGGGIYCLNNPLVKIVNCTLKNNIAGPVYWGAGGGIHCQNSDISMFNCVFKDNGASIGGGIFIADADAEIRNCLLVGNTASGQGGGIYLDCSNAAITNCTFNGNHADYDGGAIYAGVSVLDMANCILWGDTATSYYHEILGWNSTMCVSSSDIEDCGGSSNWQLGSFCVDSGGNIDSDPDFISQSSPIDYDGADNKFFTDDDGLGLQNDSPCIDAADGDIANKTDICHFKRIDDSSVSNTGTGNPTYADIGAYEKGSTYITVVTMCWIDESRTDYGDQSQSFYYPNGSSRYDYDLDQYQSLISSADLKIIFKAGCLDPCSIYPINPPDIYHSDLMPSGYSEPAEISVRVFPRRYIENGEYVYVADLDDFTEHFDRIRNGAVPDYLILLVDNTGSMTTDDIEDGYSEFVDWLSTNYPNTKIIELQFKALHIEATDDWISEITQAIENNLYESFDF